VTLLVIELDKSDIRRLLELVLGNTVVQPDSIDDAFIDAVIMDLSKRHTTDGKKLTFNFLLYVSKYVREYISVFRTISHHGQLTDEYYVLINEIINDINKK
jgi:hypothetical protein